MMIALNILLGIAAGLAFLFTIGDTKPPMSKEKRITATVAFVALLLFIIALNIIK